MENDWKELLKKAVLLLDKAGISREEWSLGGGTALMIYYHHRKSRDIDIFLTNPQYITYLSPRLNQLSEQISDRYEEQSNFLKLYLGDREIDFIIAGNLTGLLPQWKNINSLKIQIEKPEEIVIKKLFYRPYALKVRDIIDTAVVYRHNPDLTRIIKSKNIRLNLEEIQLSLKRIEKQDIKPVLQKLSLEKNLSEEDFAEYLETFKEFLKQIRKNNNPSRRKGITKFRN